MVPAPSRDSLDSLDFAILSIMFSVPGRTYRVPSCRRKRVIRLDELKLVEYTPKTYVAKLLDAGEQRLREHMRMRVRSAA